MISLALLRKKNLIDSYHITPNYNISYLYKCVINKEKPYSCLENVRKLLNDWESLSSDKSTSFDMCIPLIEMVYISKNKELINEVTKHIVNNVLPKVPDAKNVKEKLFESIKNTKKFISENFKNAEYNKYVDNSFEAFSTVLDELTIYDTTINNHEFINKRFNIDKLLKETVFSKDDIQIAVTEFCKLIETYNIFTRNKIFIALNNSIYALETNHLPYDKSEIINTVSEYFCMVHCKEDINLEEVFYRCLSGSKFYDKSDYSSLDILQEYTKLNTLQDLILEDENGIVLVKKDIDNIKSKSKDTAKSLKSTFTANNVKEYIKSFKLNPNKKPKDLKVIIEKLFAESEDVILHEIPNVFRLILAFFLLVPLIAVSAIAGVLALIVFLAVSHHFSCTSTDKLIKKYEAHIKVVDKKIKKAKNSEDKKRLEEYKSVLEKELEKLKDYRDELRSEREKEDLSNDDDDFDESVKNLSDNLHTIYNGMIYLNKHKFVKNPYRIIREKMNAISGEDIALISEFSINNPDILDPNLMLVMIKEQRDDVLKEGTMTKYIRSSILKDSIDYLASNQPKNININYNETLNEAFKELSDNIINIDAIYDSIVSIPPTDKQLLEMGITNTINMAIERVKKAASNLSDKERVASRTFDSSLEQIKHGVEKSLTIENREAVIRGDILPPMSRCIKLAILFAGAAFLLHPAIAVIGAVVTFSINKKLRDKEKQIVLDELDVEIAMCSKYINQAEDKKDMKGLKNLLMIKKKLEHERRRLRFNIIRGGSDNNKIVINKERDDD